MGDEPNIFTDTRGRFRFVQPDGYVVVGWAQATKLMPTDGLAFASSLDRSGDIPRFHINTAPDATGEGLEAFAERSLDSFNGDSPDFGVTRLPDVTLGGRPAGALAWEGTLRWGGQPESDRGVHRGFHVSTNHGGFNFVVYFHGPASRFDAFFAETRIVYETFTFLR